MEDFNIQDKHIQLYIGNGPLIILHENEEVNIDSLISEDYSLAIISNIDWNNELSPWPIVMFKQDFIGEANKYIKQLKESIIPLLLEKTKATEVYTIGYSLAGLFSLYCGYETDLFTKIGSVSGSLWYPDFKEYVLSHKLNESVTSVYLSLGNKEHKTKNKIMSQVLDNTLSIYDSLSCDKIYEENEGGHFVDPTIRIKKCIDYLTH